MAEYINRIKVPETVEELNVLGACVRATWTDMLSAAWENENIEHEENAEKVIGKLPDLRHISLTEAYRKGVECVVKKAVTEVLNGISFVNTDIDRITRDAAENACCAAVNNRDWSDYLHDTVYDCLDGKW